MIKDMWIRQLFCLAVCVFLALSVYTCYASDSKAKVRRVTAGMELPQFKLDAPGSKEEQTYLALEKREPFSLSELSAKLVIIELFSVNCPHCIKQAPKLNKLYNLIRQDPKLFDDIKMIGIAVLADQSKIDKWRTVMHVPFPLFSDLEGKIFDQFGAPGIPYTLVATNSGKVLSVHAGETEDVEILFRQIKEHHQQQ